MPGLLADWRAADLVVLKHAARVAHVELGGGLAAFHGDLDRGLVRVGRSRAGEKRGDQQVGQGLGGHGLGPVRGPFRVVTTVRGMTL